MVLFKPEMGLFKPGISPFRPGMSPFSHGVGPFGPRMGPFMPEMGPFSPGTGPIRLIIFFCFDFFFFFDNTGPFEKKTVDQIRLLFDFGWRYLRDLGPCPPNENPATASAPPYVFRATASARGPNHLCMRRHRTCPPSPGFVLRQLPEQTCFLPVSLYRQ